MMFTILSSDASAEIIEDIAVKTDANGDVDAVIKFTVPVHYIRHFPHRKSAFVAIYFNILQSVPRDQWQNYESTRSPPSDLISSFAVSTRDLSTGPKIEVLFNRPSEFDVTEGRDGRSILMHMRPEKKEQKQESKAAPSAPSVVAPLATAGAAAAAVVPSAVPKPSAPTPAVTAAQAAPAPAPAPATPPPAPAPVAAPPAPPTAPPPSLSGPSLSEREKATDKQAAALMAKGKGAMAASQLFAAIEAFNAVLRLPPNSYSEDAQFSIALAREKAGQTVKAEMEYQVYLKLYPNGAQAAWVRDRLARLGQIAPIPAAAAPVARPTTFQPTPYQFSEYGSLSMYYYTGSSHTDTITTIGGVQTPTSLTATDQSALITNVSATARMSNNEFDNRIVFQDFYAKDFLHLQQNRNRLNAAFFEVRNRPDNYYLRVGRQSALGGGVLGRFDGISAGIGITPDYRLNVVGGRLSDSAFGADLPAGTPWYDAAPLFAGMSVDFGLRKPVGGSLYVIEQKIGGMRTNRIWDRQAVGGNLRYFDMQKTVIAMVDYDYQFQKLNMFTLQGTFNNVISSTDFNYLLDHRKAPSLSIRNAVNGTTANVFTLVQNGWTTKDLLALANARTANSNTAQVGMTNHLREKLMLGTDIVVSNQSGLPATGTLNPDFTTGLEGFVPAMPSTGNTWTVTERVVANDLFTPHDLSIASISFTNSRLLAGQTLLFNNHSYLKELWTLDTTLRLYKQMDYLGGRMYLISPVVKVGYRLKSSLLLETEGGVEWTNSIPSALMASRTTRKYISLGFRWDF